MWQGEYFFWDRLTQVVPEKGHKTAVVVVIVYMQYNVFRNSQKCSSSCSLQTYNAANIVNLAVFTRGMQNVAQDIIWYIITLSGFIFQDFIQRTCKFGWTNYENNLCLKKIVPQLTLQENWKSVIKMANNFTPQKTTEPCNKFITADYIQWSKIASKSILGVLGKWLKYCDFSYFFLILSTDCPLMQIMKHNISTVAESFKVCH